ncbi:hypothetical protein ACIQM4_33240 [Streptomyces sp. NPDC091272]|uniref:hypothetical protein n=1 Tax=Streptomyces sp. NPDC091272 TaxID=3365981 RepID=UPI00381CD176
MDQERPVSGVVGNPGSGGSAGQRRKQRAEPYRRQTGQHAVSPARRAAPTSTSSAQYDLLKASRDQAATKPGTAGRVPPLEAAR